MHIMSSALDSFFVLLLDSHEFGMYTACTLLSWATPKVCFTFKLKTTVSRITSGKLCKLHACNSLHFPSSAHIHNLPCSHHQLQSSENTVTPLRYCSVLTVSHYIHLSSSLAVKMSRCMCSSLITCVPDHQQHAELQLQMLTCCACHRYNWTSGQGTNRLLTKPWPG